MEQEPQKNSGLCMLGDSPPASSAPVTLPPQAAVGQLDISAPRVLEISLRHSAVRRFRFCSVVRC